MERKVPTLVFDDGSPIARAALARAREVSTRVTIVSTEDSNQSDALVVTASSWGLPVEFVRLGSSEGIRHALALCSGARALVAFVPDPGSHRGRLIRRCVQAIARIPSFEMPGVAIHLVRDVDVVPGPVVLVTDTSVDDGFADLLAAAFAASVGAALHTVEVGPDIESLEIRSSGRGAAAEAREALLDGSVDVESRVRLDRGDVGALIDHVEGARAAVIGVGDLDIAGRKLTAPNELPDSILETPQGRLVHDLVDRARCDVVIVIDSVHLRHGAVSGGALALVAATLVGAGSIGAAAQPVAAAPAVAAASSVVAATDQVVVTVLARDTLSVSNPSGVPLRVVADLQGQHGNHGSLYDAGTRDLGLIPAGAADVVLRLSDMAPRHGPQHLRDQGPHLGHDGDDLDHHPHAGRLHPVDDGRHDAAGHATGDPDARRPRPPAAGDAWAGA